MKVKPVIFHVDLDAFYASVEQLDNPACRGKPVIVGAQPGHRGVVSACSYEARKFGIHSAMPISEAYRRCPHGIFLPVRMSRYGEFSKQIMRLFSDYTPTIQQISVDEAFLDMTGTRRLLGTPTEIAAAIKSRVRGEIGLTLSIGIASNKYVAKLASEYDKPDGLWEVRPGEEEAFIEKLELKDLWGVGKKTYERLSELNIRSVKQLKEINMDLLCRMIGKAAGEYLHRIARGIDPGMYNTAPRSHTVSNEITFEHDIADRRTIKNSILELSHHLMFRLLEEDVRAKTICLKLRYSDFSTTTVQQTTRHWVSSAEEINDIALNLLDKRWNGGTPIRLIGIGTGNVEKAGSGGQAELFEDSYDKNKRVERAVLELKKTRGASVNKASLLRKSRFNRKNG